MLASLPVDGRFPDQCPETWRKAPTSKNGPIAGATFKEARKGGTSEKSFQGTALRHRAECRVSREHWKRVKVMDFAASLGTLKTCIS
jgi:hypothetical protein